jgi:hypothetical protein
MSAAIHGRFNGVDDSNLAGWIERHAAPVGPSRIAWLLDEFRRRRGCEYAFGAIRCDALAAGAGIKPGDSPGITRGNRVLARERRRSRRNGLGRRRVLAGDRVLGYRLLHNREQRFSSYPIERVQEAGLDDLDNSWNALTIVQEIDQSRLCVYVVIPQVMMHQLLSPDQLACGTVECHKRIGPAVVARS